MSLLFLLQPVVGSASVTLSSLTQSASAAEVFVGVSTTQLTRLSTSAGSGGLSYTGSASPVLRSLSLSAGPASEAIVTVSSLTIAVTGRVFGPLVYARPFRTHAAQPRPFVSYAAQPSPFRLPVAGFQTEFESEENVAKKIWTDDIDQAVDAMADGVFLYKTGGIWSATALTMDMIGPAFAVSLSGGGMVEDGATVTNPAFTASYTSTPTGVTMNDTENATPQTIALPATSFTRTGVYVLSGLGDSVTFTVSATNGTTTVTDTAAYTAGQRVYYGAATPGTYNAAFVQALASSTVTSTRARSVVYTLTVGQRPYYFVPTGMSAPTVTIGGFVYTWTDLGAISVPNPQGVSVAGHLYAGDIAGASVSYTAVFS